MLSTVSARGRSQVFVGGLSKADNSETVEKHFGQVRPAADDSDSDSS